MSADLIRKLRDVGIGKIPHDYSGACPEAWAADAASMFTDRDNLCPACAALIEADDMLGDKVSP